MSSSTNIDWQKDLWHFESYKCNILIYMLYISPLVSLSNSKDNVYTDIMLATKKSSWFWLNDKAEAQ